MEQNAQNKGQTAENTATTGRDSLGKAVRRNLSPKRVALLAKRGFATLKDRGWQALGREVLFRFNLATHRQTWRYRADIPLRRELRAQRANPPAPAPLVSVISPLYNTPEEYLRQMIDSVRQQSYQNWELVLCDASDEGHPEVGRVAAVFAEKDKRIKYIKLPKNEGISGNTNAGIAHSSGAWLVLLDHDDVIQPNALYEVISTANRTGAELIYSDEAVLNDKLEKLWEFHFKGDYGPDTLRGCNTITHLCAFTRHLMEKAGGGERAEYDGAQDYDLILRLSEAAGETGAGGTTEAAGAAEALEETKAAGETETAGQTAAIAHIPKVLYFWRRHGGSTASGITQKPAAVKAGVAAVQAHLNRLGLDGTAQAQTGHPGAVRVGYRVHGNPLVSVLIPSSDHIEDLARCLRSLYQYGGWPNMEVLIIDNNSQLADTRAFYAEAQKHFAGLRVVRYPGKFNFADICNFGAQLANGEHFLLLNNDIEILPTDFVRELLSYSQRTDVGAVGVKLYYPDDTVQHAGLIIGIGGTAGVSHKGHARRDGGDMYRLCTTQNVSAVTGAALMVKRSLYNEEKGLDAENFAVAFNDVDFCLRLREKGLWNVFTPFAQAYHFESKSRGYDTEGPKKERFDKEAAAFRQKWAALLQKGDPFYNPHFTLEHENFGYR